MITRIRYLGSAPQWGDGGEFHGWEVSGAGRWRVPATDEEQALTRRCISMVKTTPWPAGQAKEWPFNGPTGVPAEGLDRIEQARKYCSQEPGPPDKAVDAIERQASAYALAEAEDLACDALGPGGDHSECPACRRDGPRTWAELPDQA